MAKRRSKSANGEGSILYESDRQRFRAFFTDPGGKRITKRFETRQEAVEWLTVTRAEVYKNEYIPAHDITVGQWVAEFINTYLAPKIKTRTLIRYLQTSKHLGPIADIPLQKISAMQVQKFYNNLPSLSDSSKQKIHKLLKAAFTKAQKLEVISKNIMLNVDGFKITTKEVEVFTVDEITHLLAWIKQSRYYKRYYLFIKLAIITGARLGELLGLKKYCIESCCIKIKNNLQDVNGVIKDTTLKTQAAERTITIDPTTEQELLEASSDNYVFHTKYGTPWNPHNVERAWRKILDGAKLQARKFHALRHTHATQLLANNIPLLEVSKRLGHASSTVTLKYYAHAIPGYDRKIPQKVVSIFKI